MHLKSVVLKVVLSILLSVWIRHLWVDVSSDLGLGRLVGVGLFVWVVILSFRLALLLLLCMFCVEVVVFVRIRTVVRVGRTFVFIRLVTSCRTLRLLLLQR